jgi:hypothetical protein
MNSLEKYLKNDCNNNFVIFNNLDYTYFGYENDDEMEFDLQFLIETLFPDYMIIYDEDEIEDDNIKKIIKESRPNQTTFRNNLIKKYEGKCIITGDECLDQLEACHIVPYAENKNNCMTTNGLLLKVTLHKTFDTYKWAINPTTMMIEIKKSVNEKDIGDIKEYQGIKVDLDTNDIILINNLKKRYESYLEN